jgi:hypothetical protein
MLTHWTGVRCVVRNGVPVPVSAVNTAPLAKMNDAIVMRSGRVSDRFPS